MISHNLFLHVQFCLRFWRMQHQQQYCLRAPYNYIGLRQYNYVYNHVDVRRFLADEGSFTSSLGLNCPTTCLADQLWVSAKVLGTAALRAESIHQVFIKQFSQKMTLDVE